ncbi:MAG: hypothetical protein J6T60_05145 [Bacteroidales bacterium]|nr:hypothetical protein [Bacteroidales bacterium]
MKHAAETERLFLKVTDETPDEIKMKVDWSLDIRHWRVSLPCLANLSYRWQRNPPRVKIN